MSRVNMLLLAVLVMAGSGLEAATKTWKNTTSGGNWSSSSNWKDGVPNADDDVVMPFASQSVTAIITIDKDVRINSLKINETTGGSQSFVGDNQMQIGAGGLTMVYNQSPTWGYDGQSTIAGQAPNFQVPIYLSESQRWLLGGVRGWCYEADGGFRTFTKDISSASGVEWQLLGYTHYKFTDGSSANFKGSVKLGALAYFVGTNQFSRLGNTGKIQLFQDGMESDSEASSNGTIGNAPALIYEFATGEGDGVVNNPIEVTAIDYASQFTSGSKKTWVSTISGDSGRRGWSYRHVPIAMKLQEGEESEPCKLTFTKGISGQIPNSDISLTFAQPRMISGTTNPFIQGNMNPFEQRIVLMGDGSGLNGAVTAMTMVEIANANALGYSNCRTVKLGMDGWWSAGQNGYDVHGLFLRPGLSFTGDLAPQTRSDGSGANRRPGVIMLGAAETPAKDGETIATFTKPITADCTCDILRFGSAAKDVCAKFTGKITSVFNQTISKSGSAISTKIYGGHVDIIGWGDIAFSNSENSFDTNIWVRSGGLALESDKAGGTKPIILGGRIPWMNETKSVRCVMANTPSKTYTLSDSGTLYGKKLSWTRKPPTTDLDGINTRPGDYVLVAIPYPTAINGIWLVGENAEWTRPDELDDPEDIINGKFGMRVKVTEGNRFANKAFMLTTNPLYYRCSSQYAANGEKFNAASGAPIFQLEGDAEPDVALKTAGKDVELTCQVVVADNNSTGESAIGSLESGISTFAGTITLEKDLTLVAAKGSELFMKCTIAPTNSNMLVNLISSGDGTNNISSAQVQLKGADSKFIMKSGILRVGSTQMEVSSGVYRKLSWKRVLDKTSPTGDKTGVLLVDGNAHLENHDLDLTGLAVYLTDGDSPKTRRWPIVRATGTITAPESVTLPAGWTLVLENNSRETVDSVLYAQYINPGFFMEIQ